MIPLEDNHEDIIGKAMRGLSLSAGELCQRAGIQEAALNVVLAGECDEAILRAIAPQLNLGVEALLASARKSWHPRIDEAPDGVLQFNTAYHDMTVNAYLLWDLEEKSAVVFDTGADVTPILEAIGEQGLNVESILLTHTHADHIADLERLKEETGAPAWVNRREAFAGAESFDYGREFQMGKFKIATLQTTGHAQGGTTFLVKGWNVPVAVVGDAIFAGSMGGGIVSFAEALETNRQNVMSLPDETLLCPGHGPITCVALEKMNNPFFPEFQ